MLAHARLTIGRKLALCFAAVVTIFVAALLLAAHFDGKAQNEWRTLLRWDRGYAAIQQEVAGTRTQMAAQALYAATFDRRRSGRQIGDPAPRRASRST